MCVPVPPSFMHIVDISVVGLIFTFFFWEDNGFENSSKEFHCWLIWQVRSVCTNTVSVSTRSYLCIRWFFMNAAFIAIVLPAESTGSGKTSQPNRTFYSEVKYWKVPAQGTLEQVRFGAQSISLPSFTFEWCGSGNVLQTFPNHGKCFALALDSCMDIQIQNSS